MEEENLKLETIFDFKLGEDTQPEEDVKYNCLYDELKAKCIPTNFLSNEKKYYKANDLYTQLSQLESQIKSKDNDLSLLKIRNQAIEYLGINISTGTQKKYEYLYNCFNPDNYIKREPYDAEKVKKAGECFFKLKAVDKTNVLELERIEREESAFIEELKAEKKRKQEEIRKLEEKRRQEEIRKLEEKRQEEERLRKEQLEDERKSNIVLLISFIIGSITVGIILLMAASW